MHSPQENWARLKGLFNITLTPFHKNGEMDRDGLVENIERVIGLGYDGLLIGGTYGEFGVMDTAERATLFRSAMEAAKGRVPVMLCIASADMREVDQLMELACALDGVPMALPPLVSEVNDGHILAYFERLAAMARGGLVIYNAPRVAVTLRPELIERLADIPGVIGIKQGDLAPAVVDDIANRLGGRLRLFCASDLSYLGPILAGFDGVRSTNSCAFPELILQSYRALEFGDAHLARELHGAWYPYRALARRYGQPQTTKAAMNTRGFAGGSVRPPLKDLDDSQTAELVDVIHAINATLRPSASRAYAQ
jgi:4-hydroxy-tetrahydrodipicolinate synthase